MNLIYLIYNDQNRFLKYSKSLCFLQKINLNLYAKMKNYSNNFNKIKINFSFYFKSKSKIKNLEVKLNRF